MPSNVIPLKVLTEQVAEAIEGRRMRSAVFTTFTFDPGFFEINVLPVLFDQPFSQPDKVRRLQLEDALRTIDHVAVYYDRRALAQDGEPAQLDYRRLDVSRSTGYFHPKVILLLVDDHRSDDGSARVDKESDEPIRQALIVGILSANMTRAGWWENVECAHIEEIKDREIDGERCAFRPDLLSLIRRIRQSANDSDDQSALNAVGDFLLRRTERGQFGKNRSTGRYHTRIFGGQSRDTLSDWLSQLSLDRYELNLEVISPFFDLHGEGPLGKVIETIRPREVRVYHPTAPDGSSLVSRQTYDAIRALDSTHWARPPSEVVNRGRDQISERLAPRRVHAKLYRLWRREGPDLLLVGSPNLTTAGHSHGAAGNLEAAFLVDISELGYPRRWWLERLDYDVDRFASMTSTEDDGLDAVGLDLSLQFDWSDRELSYRLESPAAHGFSISTTEREPIVTVERPRHRRWTSLGARVSQQLAKLLVSTSFLLIKYKDRFWRVLVREENMGYRPSLLMQLTPEEILEYWSLLTPAQRAQFIESHIVDQVEGLPVVPVDGLHASNTLFDRFAGIYHAFGCLERAVDRALEDGRDNEAEALLLGAKYDSLPNLLEKTIERSNGDRILAYVTFLCATQLRHELHRRHQRFFKQRATHVARLDARLDSLADLRSAIELDDPAADDFFQWYEGAFLRSASHSGGWR